MKRTTSPVNLMEVAGAGGVVWSASPGGFHANLVVLDGGGSIAAHRNDAVDVLLIVLAGAGTVSVDGEDHALAPAVAVQVPSGSTRAITAGPEGLRYLTVHAEREPLGISRPHPDSRGA
jgi:quercetin dioxygenase-like cupin family protein